MRKLIAPDSRQQQQLEQGPERPADRIAAEPEEPNLLIVEVAVALDCCCRRPDTVSRVLLDDILPNRPAEHCPEIGKYVIGVARRPTIDDLGEQFTDLASA